MRGFYLLVLWIIGACQVAPVAQAEDAGASAAPKASECIAQPQEAAAAAQYGGKTYYFKSQACKDQFLSDPERYSQLYDALLELKAEGKTLQKPKPMDNASAVPS